MGCNLISIPHSAVQFLRPLSALEIGKDGSTKDITLRLCASYLGENIFLDESKSYVLLGVMPGHRSYHGYGENTPWSVQEDAPTVARILKQEQYLTVSKLLCEVKEEGWSTNLGRKSNFTVSRVSIAQWRNVWSNYCYYILTNDYEELVEVAPWIGTRSESYIMRNFAKMQIENVGDGPYYAEWKTRILPILTKVLDASWATEPPPLIMGYDCLDELLTSYKRVHASGTRTWVSTPSYIQDMSRAVKTILSMLDTYKVRYETSSVWRWIKDFTTLHRDIEEIEHRFKPVLDRHSKKNVKGVSGTCIGSSSGSYIGTYVSGVVAIRDNTPLLKALKSQLLEIAKVIVKKDNSINQNWMQLKEEYNLTARDCVRRKGSVKRGEYILREVLDCVDDTILKSLPRYKKWLTGMEPSIPSHHSDSFCCRSDEDGTKMVRMGSSRSYRAGLLSAWCISESSNPSRDEAKVPLSLRKTMGDPSALTSNTLADIVTSMSNAGFTSKLIPYLKELVGRYKQEEELTLSISLGNLEAPFVTTEVGRSLGIEPSSPAPSVLVGYSVMAELLYDVCRKLEESLPHEAAHILNTMASTMGELLVNEAPHCSRKEYRIVYLRELADPAYWAPKTQA